MARSENFLMKAIHLTHLLQNSSEQQMKLSSSARSLCVSLDLINKVLDVPGIVTAWDKNPIRIRHHLITENVEYRNPATDENRDNHCLKTKGGLRDKVESGK